MHETGHLLSIPHCSRYMCNMNGRAGLKEFDRSPLTYCPDCLAKLLYATGADPRKRFAELEQFCRAHEIRAHDLEAVRSAVDLPINLEMATTEEMLSIATRFKPHAACLVPEKREERTTEGGLDVARLHRQVEPFVRRLREAGSRVSLFIEPSKAQVDTAFAMGAPVVEFHTGKYVELVFAGDTAGASDELKRLQEAASHGHAKGIEIHAGHGLTYATVRPVAAIPEVRELNIGHFIMGEALFVGLEAAVRRMRQEIDAARGFA